MATPVTPQIDLPFLPFVFDISMAVRRCDTALKEQLDAVIERKQSAIDAILREYGVRDWMSAHERALIVRRRDPSSRFV